MTAALLLHRADGALLDTPFHQAAFGAADPLALHREIAWQRAGALCAGRVRFVGELQVADYPHTEILVVVDGELSLRATGAAPLLLGPGAGAVIARGTALQLQAVADARFVFCAVAGPQAGAGITPLRAEADYQPSNPPAAELLLGPVPQCRSANVFRDEATQVLAGTWDSTPYQRIVRPHPVNEFMFLLAGTVDLAGPDGQVLSSRAGDAVFVPQGAPVGWHSRERVAKFYVVQDVKA
jgi:uncharacterized cupin superfamily protein